jgi:hypothetical protein
MERQVADTLYPPISFARAIDNRAHSKMSSSTPADVEGHAGAQRLDHTADIDHDEHEHFSHRAVCLPCWHRLAHRSRGRAKAPDG